MEHGELAAKCKETSAKLKACVQAKRRSEEKRDDLSSENSTLKAQLEVEVGRRRLQQDSEVEVSDRQRLAIAGIAGKISEKAKLMEALGEVLDGRPQLLALMTSNLCSIARDLQGTNAKRGKRYSQHFIRILIVIYTRGKGGAKEAATEHLLSELDDSTISAYLKALLPDMGVSNNTVDQMARRAELYWKKHKATWTGRRQPRGEGAVVFDEVILKQGVAMNASSNKLLGFAWNDKQLYDLSDIYALCDTTAKPKCKYVMQSMWRCLHSRFDVKGPVMCSTTGLNHSKISDFFWQSVEVFQNFGFETHVAAADGASANLKFFVETCALNAAHMGPFCYNPHTDGVIHFRFDDPHMLKNLRNALESNKRNFTASRAFIRRKWATFEEERKQSHGSTTFDSSIYEPSIPPLPRPDASSSNARAEAAFATADRVGFGWQNLRELAKRNKAVNGVSSELQQLLSPSVLNLTNLSKMSVPYALKPLHEKVQTAFIVEIMRLRKQQVAITAARGEEGAGEAREVETAILSMQATVLYLEAVRRIYVDFGMARSGIKSESDPRVLGFVKGFNFFDDWHSDVREIPLEGSSLTLRNKHGLHHITWTEMKVHVVGTLSFIRHRFSVAPNDPLWPRRWGQSIIESFFSTVRGMGSGFSDLNFERYCRRSAAHDVHQETKVLRRGGPDGLDLEKSDGLYLHRYDSRTSQRKEDVDALLEELVAAASLFDFESS